MKRLLLLLLLIVPFVYGANTPPHVNLEISGLPEDYILYIIRISDYNLPFNELNDFYHSLDYDSMKSTCVDNVRVGDIECQHYRHNGKFFFETYFFNKLLENNVSVGYHSYYCSVEDGVCKINFFKEGKGPYYVVLEGEKTYYSEPININTSSFDWKSFEPITYSQEITKLELGDPLIIEFEGASKTITPKSSLFDWLKRWLIFWD